MQAPDLCGLQELDDFCMRSNSVGQTNYLAKRTLRNEDRLSYQGENSVEIDHLLFGNSEKIQFKKKNLLLIKEPVVSDHRPLIAEFEVIF